MILTLFLDSNRRARRPRLAAALLSLAAVAAPAATLTLAVAQTPHYAAVLLAEREGYFAAEGLDV